MRTDQPDDFVVDVVQICSTDRLGYFENPWGDDLYAGFSERIFGVNLASYLDRLDPRPTFFSIDRLKPDAELKREYRRLNPRIMTEPACAYRFRFMFARNDFSSRAAAHFKRFGKEKQSQLSTATFFSIMANSFANRIAILANLVAPGFCDSHACIIKTSLGFINVGENLTTHAYEAFFDKFIAPYGKWREIDFRDVLTWSNSVSGFWTGAPKTNIERGFCYFSYLFPRGKSEGYYDTAVWAFGALDAIFSDSHVATLEKLRRRTALVLREAGFPASIKGINFLYNDRSRTFHGDVDFAANYSDPYWEENQHRHDKGVYGSISTAFFLLISTFRLVVEMRTNVITFKEYIGYSANQL